METPDQAATRRRWISLAEVVAVLGVVIAGISLYLSWADRRADRADQVAAKTQESRAASVVTLHATSAKGGDQLDLADPSRPVDSVDLAFPTALKVAPQETMLKPAIEADWLKGPLLDLTKHGKDVRSGRVPVLITSNYWDGDTKHSDRAIYDVMWKSEGGLFGRSLKLQGATLRERGGSVARLDALWMTLAPK